jgi:hypothetical protein
MLREIEQNINTTNRIDDYKLKELMQKSILHIARILHPPSVTSIATHTRLLATETHNELKAWIETNKERFLYQRKLFTEFLNRFQSLHSRIKQIN